MITHEQMLICLQRRLSNMKKTWPIEHLDCPNCAAKLESALQKLPGVESASVNFTGGTVTITAPDSRMAEITRAMVETAARVEPDARILLEESPRHSHNHAHEHNHDHGEAGHALLWRVAAAAVLLAGGLVTEGILSLLLFLAAYLTAGWDILLTSVRNIAKGEIFDENFLMSVASIGAMCVGEYAEGVLVIVLYQIGEWFQARAVGKSRASITALMDIRPDHANLLCDGQPRQVSPEDVHTGDLILVRPGEKVPLDGVIVEGSTSLNTVALTGESLPRDASVGDSVLSGSVNLSGLITMRVTGEYAESTVSKILRLVESSGDRKARAEQFITRFARVYTPAVCAAAVLLAVIPSLLDGQWSQWIHRALTFLVISCPCALVISVPLTFFSGIGGASRRGVLVKGANDLETLARLDTVVFDKTGTLTRGVFTVTALKPQGCTEETLLETAALAESSSSHPIARSILSAYGREIDQRRVTHVEETAGHGLRATVDGRAVVAGNARLMDALGIAVPQEDTEGTVVHVAADGSYMGRIVISDVVKPTSRQAMAELKQAGISRLVMLTGDRRHAADAIARQLGLTEVHAELLPADKVERLEGLLGEGHTVAFVGDGINDAPVLRRADLGLAMGGVGSDAAIEAADVVLMDDDPCKLPLAIRIARKTLRIVRQNIVFSLGIKAVVMVLGALGYAGMGLAVFADVGVALLAILNAMRAMK